MTAGDFDEAVHRIQRLLLPIDDLDRRLRAGSDPLPGTLSGADASLPESRFVRLHAFQALGTALDHLSAWQTLVYGPQLPLMAHMTLLRAAIDGAFRAMWLVDDKVDSRTRVARGFAAKLHDLEEHQKFERAAGTLPKLRVATVDQAERIAELKAKRVASKLPAERYARSTDLARTFGEERAFRLTSGAAHGVEWAMRAHRGGPGPGPWPPESVARVKFTTSGEMAETLTEIAMRLVEQATVRFETYLGLTTATEAD